MLSITIFLAIWLGERLWFYSLTRYELLEVERRESILSINQKLNYMFCSPASYKATELSSPPIEKSRPLTWGGFVLAWLTCYLSAFLFHNRLFTTFSGPAIRIHIRIKRHARVVLGKNPGHLLGNGPQAWVYCFAGAEFRHIG